MKKIIAVVLVVLAVLIGYVGFNKVANSSESVNILGLKIEASDESAKTEGFVYIGVGVALLVGGVYMLGRVGK